MDFDSEIVKIRDFSRSSDFYKNSENTINVWWIELVSTDDGAITIHRCKRRNEKTAARNSVTFTDSEMTSALDQALKTCLADIKGKLKDGYTINTSGESPKLGIYPMTCNVFEVSKRSALRPPYYVQRKYNGIRCFCCVSGDEMKMETQDKQPIVAFPEIYDELCEIYERYDHPNDLFIDGELYIEDGNINVLMSITRSTVNVDMENPNRSLVKYYIFDMYDKGRPDMAYDTRKSVIEKQIFTLMEFKYLVCVETKLAMSFEQADAMTRGFIKEGYEGAIFRRPDGKYIPKVVKAGQRSPNVQKYKIGKYDDAVIIGVEKGKETNIAFSIKIRVKDLNKDIVFTLNGIGTNEYKRKFYEHRHQYIRSCKIQYTYHSLNQSGKPMSPVITMTKDDEYVLINLPEPYELGDDEIQESSIDIDEISLADTDADADVGADTGTDADP